MWFRLNEVEGITVGPHPEKDDQIVVGFRRKNDKYEFSLDSQQVAGLIDQLSDMINT